jgi:hypothetical protein
MVVLEIDGVGTTVGKAKGDPPVGTYGDGPSTLAVARQRMQPERRLIHVIGPPRGIERGKDEAKPADMLGTHFAAVVIFKKELQSPCAESSRSSALCKTSIDICQGAAIAPMRGAGQFTRRELSQSKTAAPLRCAGQFCREPIG